MPFRSIQELPPEFQGLPERGKRIAVQIMNVLEEQSLTGPAATQKAMAMLNTLFNQGAGTWGTTATKAASVAGSLAAMAKLYDFMGTSADVAEGYGKAVNLNNFAQHLGHGVEGRVNPRVMLAETSLHKEKRSMDMTKLSAKMAKEYNDMLFKLADIAIANNAPVNVAVYKDGKQVGQTKLGAFNFMQAFPTVGCIIKISADKAKSYKRRLETLHEKTAAARMEKIAGDFDIGKIPGVLASIWDLAKGKATDAQKMLPNFDIPTGVMSSLPFLVMGGGAMAASKLNSMYQRNQAYKKMFELHPDLAEADPAKVGNYYNVISNYSPTISKDPMTAGAVIKQMMQFPDVIPLDQIKTLASIEQSTGDSLDSRISDTTQRLLTSNIETRSNPQNMLYNKLYF